MSLSHLKRTKILEWSSNYKRKKPWNPSGAFLSVDIFSVPDIQDQDDELVILNLIDHTVVTLSDTPPGTTFEFFRS